MSVIIALGFCVIEIIALEFRDPINEMDVICASEFRAHLNVIIASKFSTP